MVVGGPDVVELPVVVAVDPHPTPANATDPSTIAKRILTGSRRLNGPMVRDGTSAVSQAMSRRVRQRLRQAVHR